MKTALRPRPAATASPAPQSQLQSQLQPQPQPRSLVTWNLDPAAYCSAHEHATRSEFARRLAVLTGCTYAGDYDERQPYATAPYFVPSNTVTDAGLAQAMGIAGVHDLF